MFRRGYFAPCPRVPTPSPFPLSLHARTHTRAAAAPSQTPAPPLQSIATTAGQDPGQLRPLPSPPTTSSESPLPPLSIPPIGTTKSNPNTNPSPGFRMSRRSRFVLWVSMATAAPRQRVVTRIDDRQHRAGQMAFTDAGDRRAPATASLRHGWLQRRPELLLVVPLQGLPAPPPSPPTAAATPAVPGEGQRTKGEMCCASSHKGAGQDVLDDQLV